MSGIDANPFADPYENNPFSDPSVTQATSQAARSRPAQDDYNPFANQPTKPPVSAAPQANNQTIRSRLGMDQFNPFENQPTKPSETYTKTVDQPAILKPTPERPPSSKPVPTQESKINTTELERRQQELERKAAELQAREDAFRNVSINPRANNWPPVPSFCCFKPFFFLDIGLEIPLEFQPVVRAVYYLWIFYVCLLCLNVVGALALMIQFQKILAFVFALLCMCLFIPMSFFCWFRPVYNGFRTGSSISFMSFFLCLFFQVIVSIIYAIGITNAGSCGYYNGIQAVSGEDRTSGDYVVGGIVLFIAVLWTLKAVLSALLLSKVHRIYRGTGASFDKAQAEFTTSVISNEHVQNAATNAAAGAARGAVQQTFSAQNQNRN